MMKVAFAILILSGMTAWGQAQKDTSGTPPKPPGSAQRINRAEAYYHFVLAHVYEDEATFGGKLESAKKAAEHFQAALKADPNAPVTSEELAGNFPSRFGRFLQTLAPRPPQWGPGSALPQPADHSTTIAEPSSPPPIKAWADENAPLIVTHLSVSTLFAAVAWLLAVALKKNRAQTRYWVWLVASMTFLLPFGLLVSAGSHVSWRTQTGTPPGPGFKGDPAPDFATVTPGDYPSLSSADEPPITDLIPTILLLVWGSGFGVLVLRWGRDWMRMRRIVRSATALEFGLPVRVRSSSALLEPGIFGFFRPTLLLPEGIADTLSPEQLQTILAHEMCHVRRRDNLAVSLHMVVEAVFWFHPLVWWIRARLLEERERACDEEVVRSGNDPQTYAEGILKVCELYAKAPLECVAGVAGGNLKHRVEAIMTNCVTPRLSVRRKALLASAAILTLATPLAVGLMNAPPRDPNGAAFKVVSIRLGGYTSPLERVSRDLPGFLPDGRFTYEGSIRRVIAMAYNLPLSPSGFQLKSVPDWIDPSISPPQPGSSGSSGPDRMESKDIPYTIDATGIFPPGLSQEARVDRERAMLQNLLANRFKLRIHHESGEMPVLALMVEEGGPKLQKADIEEKDCPAPDPLFPAPVDKNLCHNFLSLKGSPLLGRAVDMPDLLRWLQGSTSYPVVDKTGIKGLYRIEMTGGLDFPQLNEGSIRDAAQQLGLKFKLQNDKVDVYVIDHIEKPALK